MATAAKTKGKTKASTNAPINKAEEIRKAAREVGGKKVRPKDVIAVLAAKGITVSSPQVSSTLRAAGYRRLRRRKNAASPKTSRTSASTEISLNDLLAAKALIGKVGSIEAAREAIAVWAKLA